MILAALLALVGADAAMEPSGKWTVDYRPDMCVASRPFGPATAPTVFGFEPAVSMNSGGATLLVLSPQSRGGGVRRGSATVALLPSGEKKTLDYVSWASKAAGGQRAYEVTIDADFMAELGQSTGLSMNAGKDSVALATGPLPTVLAAMKTCNDDLMRSWGVDPAATATPVGNPGEWFTDDDYPAAAKRRGASGRVVAIVMADPTGHATSCRIVSSSKDPDLDAATCDQARKRGRFQPRAGNGFSVLSVRWVLTDM